MKDEEISSEYLNEGKMELKVRHVYIAGDAELRYGFSVSDLQVGREGS